MRGGGPDDYDERNWINTLHQSRSTQSNLGNAMNRGGSGYERSSQQYGNYYNPSSSPQHATPSPSSSQPSSSAMIGASSSGGPSAMGQGSGYSQYHPTQGNRRVSTDQGQSYGSSPQSQSQSQSQQSQQGYGSQYGYSGSSQQSRIPSAGQGGYGGQTGNGSSIHHGYASNSSGGANGNPNSGGGGHELELLRKRVSQLEETNGMLKHQTRLLLTYMETNDEAIVRMRKEILGLKGDVASLQNQLHAATSSSSSSSMASSKPPGGANQAQGMNPSQPSNPTQNNSRIPSAGRRAGMQYSGASSTSPNASAPSAPSNLTPPERARGYNTDSVPNSKAITASRQATNSGRGQLPNSSRPEWRGVLDDPDDQLPPEV